MRLLRRLLSLFRRDRDDPEDMLLASLEGLERWEAEHGLGESYVPKTTTSGGTTVELEVRQ